MAEADKQAAVEAKADDFRLDPRKFVESNRPVVLDGGLATQLEAQGHDLSDNLWSARLLDDDPSAIETAHEHFLRAGAQIITSASYQAHYTNLGDPERAKMLLTRSVDLARSAIAHFSQAGHEKQVRPSLRYVAASIGPYGAVLADGSEYRGDYSLTQRELADWHRPRLATLIEARPDFLAVETIPSLSEALALVSVLHELQESANFDSIPPAWLSFQCRNDCQIADKTQFQEALEAVLKLDDQLPGPPMLIAVGFNCTSPVWAPKLAEIAQIASRKYSRWVVAYPNSGEQWDGEHRVWAPEKEGQSGFWAEKWLEKVDLVGGCCRVFPKDVAKLVEWSTEKRKS